MKKSAYLKIGFFLLASLMVLPSTGLAQYYNGPGYIFQTPDVITYPNSEYGNVFYQPKVLLNPSAPVTTYFPVDPYSLPRQYPPPVNHYIGYGSYHVPAYQYPPYVIPDWYSRASTYTYPSAGQSSTWYSQSGY